MITKIDIANFGSYQNYSWNESVTKEFGNRNIIYGRNYSGKTTLSRIYRSIEQKMLHEDFHDGKFSIHMDNGEEINETQLSQSNLNIRVYNSDFKNDNLSILNDKEGRITPITILGEKNIEIEKNLEEAQRKKEEKNIELGNIQEKSGILWEIHQLETEKDKLKNKLKNKFTKKAGDINRNSELFKWSEKKKQYNRTDLMNEVKNAKPLSSEQKQKYKNIIKDNVKQLIQSNKEKDERKIFTDLYKETRELLLKEVKPSKSIEGLLGNNALQQWVMEGVDFHRDKRDSCAFCQSKLDSSLWEKIDAHFTKESENYKKEITLLIEKVKEQIDYWDDYSFVSKENFYSKFTEEYDLIYEKWIEVKEKQIKNLKYILRTLEERSDDIFIINTLDTENIVDVFEEIEYSFKAIESLINKNNEYTDNLDSEQNQARNFLRLDEVHRYLVDIDYDEKQQEIQRLKETKDKLHDKRKEISDKIETLNIKIREWESEINDEEKAVEQINLYLSSFLGHPELFLEVHEDEVNEKKTKFKIMRNDEEAYNLSEGEQSLIAFCYFLSSLKDISQPEEYIIFVDDPISSLDGNNLFYVFSLIDSEIARKKYKQLFVSTHNLDLLKYLQRIEKPTNNNKWRNKFFLIEKRSSIENSITSNILEMPNYLKKYATEFIYLFEQISIVTTENQNDSNYHSFYNFPNVARKFLESYLFFKYPDYAIKNDHRLNLFFGDSMESISFINRINNEFSHGENQFDRLKRPIDIPEFKKDAQLIIAKIADVDIEQFNSLCNSVGLDKEKLQVSI